MRPTLLIFWAPFDLGIFQNILFELKKSNDNVETLQVKHLNDKSAFWRNKGIKNSSLPNVIYLLYQILKINYRIFFYRKVYIFGTNAVVFALPHIVVNRAKIIAHLNELPKFLDGEMFLFSSIERLVLRKIKWLVISNNERLQLLGNYISADVKTFVLENVLNYRYYSVQNPNFLIKTEEPYFKFIYAGMISKNRDIHLLVDFFSGNKKTKLDLVGPVDQDYREEFLKSIQGSSTVTWHGVVNFEQTQKFILSANFGVALYTLKNNNNKFCAPVKIHEYFYQRLPVLVYHNPSLRNIIQNYKIALAIDDLVSISQDDFNKRVTEFCSHLNNQQFIDFEQRSLSDFKTEFERLKSVALA